MSFLAKSLGSQSKKFPDFLVSEISYSSNTKIKFPGFCGILGLGSINPNPRDLGFFGFLASEFLGVAIWDLESRKKIHPEVSSGMNA